MKHLDLKKQIALLAIVAIAFTACKKTKDAEPMGDAGQTLVKILAAGTPNSIVNDPIDFVSTPFTLTKGVVDIRRDVPNSTELNRTMTVVVKDDTTAINFFNADTVSTNANRTNPDKLFYVKMPAAWYTPVASDNVAKVGGIGGTWTFTFKPGEFAKQINLNIPNATVLDPSTKYALGFTLVSADANGIITSQKTLIVVIGAKNAWDGIWNLTGYILREADPLLTGPVGPMEVTLATIGARTVDMLEDHPWANGSGSVLSATVQPFYTVNADNSVTTYSSGGPFPGGIMPIPGYPSRYEAASKTIYAASTWSGGPTNRAMYDTLVYVRPR